MFNAMMIHQNIYNIEFRKAQTPAKNEWSTTHFCVGVNAIVVYNVGLPVVSDIGSNWAQTNNTFK
jgi:hypothetical protein